MNQPIKADFATVSDNGTIIKVGKSQISSPELKFKGGTIKWFDDTKLLRKKINTKAR